MTFEGECTEVKPLLARIVGDLCQRFPEAEAEFYFGSCSNPRPQRVRGPIATVLAALQQACGPFPGAWVSYEPDHPYGLVLKMIGHCGKAHEHCDETCEQYRERPRTILTIARQGTPRVVLGEKVTSSAI